MQDLTLVGLTEDRRHLVLVSDTGVEYSLPVDANLRAALRGDHARLGQLEIQMESALRPRDIQARIRSGESPEKVAAAAQTTVEKIMGFATPVLAERAHVADRAQRASVRRAAGEGPSRVLGEAVAERLSGRNVDPKTVEWDAWRREDGRWTLVADYLSGESQRHAEFVFDPPGLYVVAEDDEARWLVGEPSTRTGPQPRAAGTGPRRLSAVGSDAELPLGEDAIGMVSGPGPEALDPGFDTRPDTGFETADEETTEDLTGAASAVRGGDADWIATQASDRPEPAQAPEPPDEAADRSTDESPDAAGAPETGAAPDDTDDPDDTDEEPAAPARRSRGRASVPSWDEIMFGGGKTE